MVCRVCYNVYCSVEVVGTGNVVQGRRGGDHHPAGLSRLHLSTSHTPPTCTGLGPGHGGEKWWDVWELRQNTTCCTTSVPNIIWPLLCICSVCSKSVPFLYGFEVFKDIHSAEAHSRTSLWMSTVTKCQFAFRRNIWRACSHSHSGKASLLMIRFNTLALGHLDLVFVEKIILWQMMARNASVNTSEMW